MTDNNSHAPKRSWPLMAALALLVAGLYAAGYLVYAKLNVIFQAPGFASECNISSALNCDALSCVAATLANGGVCPLTGQRLLQKDTVSGYLLIQVEDTRPVLDIILHSESASI